MTSRHRSMERALSSQNDINNPENSSLDVNNKEGGDWGGGGGSGKGGGGGDRRSGSVEGRGSRAGGELGGDMRSASQSDYSETLSGSRREIQDRENSSTNNSSSKMDKNKYKDDPPPYTPTPSLHTRINIRGLLKRSKSSKNGYPGMLGTSMEVEYSPSSTLYPPSIESRGLTPTADRNYNRLLQNKLVFTRLHGKTSLQARIYNFLERPTGWKCFIYHFTV